MMSAIAKPLDIKNKMCLPSPPLKTLKPQCGWLLLSSTARRNCFKETHIAKFPMGIFSAEYSLTIEYLKISPKIDLKE